LSAVCVRAGIPAPVPFAPPGHVDIEVTAPVPAFPAIIAGAVVAEPAPPFLTLAVSLRIVQARIVNGYRILPVALIRAVRFPDLPVVTIFVPVAVPALFSGALIRLRHIVSRVTVPPVNNAHPKEAPVTYPSHFTFTGNKKNKSTSTSGNKVANAKNKLAWRYPLVTTPCRGNRPTSAVAATPAKK
jgi:hypothetical protein